MTGRLHTTDDVAEVLRVRRRKAQQLISRGELPACRIGTQYRVTDAALQAFIERGGERREGSR